MQDRTMPMTSGKLSPFYNKRWTDLPLQKLDGLMKWWINPCHTMTRDIFTFSTFSHRLTSYTVLISVFYILRESSVAYYPKQHCFRHTQLPAMITLNIMICGIGLYVDTLIQQCHMSMCELSERAVFQSNVSIDCALITLLQAWLTMTRSRWRTLAVVRRKVW